MDGSGKESSSSSSGASSSTAVKDKEPVANHCNSTHNKKNNLNSNDDIISSNTTKQEIHTSNIQNNVSTEVRQISEETPLFKQALESLSQQAATSSPQRQIDASVHPISTATTTTTASSITNRRSMNDSPPNIQNLEESYFNKSPSANNNNNIASNIKPDISTSNNIGTINNGNNTTTTTTSPPPSQENITQLTNMGFNREEVIDALRHTDNNINAAADRLLNIETMTPPRKQAEPIETSRSTGSLRRGGDKDKNSGKKATFSEDTDMSKTRETRIPIPRKRDATVSQSLKKKNSTSTNPEVIDLLDDSSDSDDNLEDRKMPAKKKNVGKRSIEMEESDSSDSDWEEEEEEEEEG